MSRLNKNKGFTLIELLVVIAIIGILSSVVLSSLTSARQRAQATAMQQESNQALLALEIYYTEYGGYPYGSGDDGAHYCIAAQDLVNVTPCISADIDRLVSIESLPGVEIGLLNGDNTNMVAAANVAFPAFKNNKAVQTTSGEFKGVVYTTCKAQFSQLINGVEVCPIFEQTSSSNGPFITFPHVVSGQVTVDYKIPGTGDIEIDIGDGGTE